MLAGKILLWSRVRNSAWSGRAGPDDAQIGGWGAGRGEGTGYERGGLFIASDRVPTMLPWRLLRSRRGAARPVLGGRPCIRRSPVCRATPRILAARRRDRREVPESPARRAPGAAP